MRPGGSAAESPADLLIYEFGGGLEVSAWFYATTGTSPGEPDLAEASRLYLEHVRTFLAPKPRRRVLLTRLTSLQAESNLNRGRPVSAWPMSGTSSPGSQIRRRCGGGRTRTPGAKPRSPSQTCGPRPPGAVPSRTGTRFCPATGRAGRNTWACKAGECGLPGGSQRSRRLGRNSRPIQLHVHHRNPRRRQRSPHARRVFL